MPEIETTTPGCTHYSFNELIKCTAHNFKRLGHGDAPESLFVGLALLNAKVCLQPKDWFSNSQTSELPVWPWSPQVISSAIDHLVSTTEKRNQINRERASNSGKSPPNGITLAAIATAAEQPTRQGTWEKLREAGFEIGAWREGFHYFDIYYADNAELRAKISEWQADAVEARINGGVPRTAKAGV